MGFRDYIGRLKNNYVINKVENTRMPDFDTSPIIRKKMIFSGKVQKVGFRLEIYELAKRLSLTGWVKNRKDNRVELEVQGENNKILFLVDNMKDLKRAKVTDIEKDLIPLVNDEDSLVIIKE